MGAIFCKFFPLFLLSIFCVVLAKYGYYAYLNYTGYCLAENSILTDQQKEDLAIKKIIELYPTLGEKENKKMGRSSKDNNIKIIPYKDVDDFKRINKNCCQVMRQSNEVEFPPATLLDRVAGVKSSFVKIEYIFRYQNERHDYVATKRKSMVVVTNCGVVWNGI